MTYTIQSTIQWQVAEPPPPPAVQLWRVLHDAERGPLWRWNVPEVYPLGGVAIPLDEAWQLFTKALNPDMTPIKWRRLMGYQTAFTNFDSGFDYPNGSLKPDYVNRLDLTATGKLKYDKPRVCGGALVTGMEGYSVLQMLKDTLTLIKMARRTVLARNFRASVRALVTNNVLTVSALDGNQPPPALADLKPYHKFVALNVVNETTLSRFPQGGGADVWIPLVAREVVKIPLSQLAKVDMSKSLPSPYMVYNSV